MENENKKVWVWAVIGALVVAGLWWYVYYQPSYQAPGAQPQAVQPQAVQPLSGGDTTADITNDLNSVDLGDIDKDLQQFDADIEQL